MGRRLIFWDFPRASWQYDLVVGLILVFIFAIPREFFHDQPKAAPIILIGSNQFFLSHELLELLPPNQRIDAASRLIHARMGKNWRVARIETLRDEAEQEVKGYIAYTSQQN